VARRSAQLPYKVVFHSLPKFKHNNSIHFSVLFYHTQYTEAINIVWYVNFVALFQHRKKIFNYSIGIGTRLITGLETLTQ